MSTFGRKFFHRHKTLCSALNLLWLPSNILQMKNKKNKMFSECHYVLMKTNNFNFWILIIFLYLSEKGKLKRNLIKLLLDLWDPWEYTSEESRTIWFTFCLKIGSAQTCIARKICVVKYSPFIFIIGKVVFTRFSLCSLIWLGKYHFSEVD